MKLFNHTTTGILILSALMIVVTCGCQRQERTSQPEKTKPTEKKPAAAITKPAKEMAEPRPNIEKPGAVRQPVVKKDKPESVTPLSPSTILVKVNDATITQGDVDKEMANMQTMMTNRGMPSGQINSMLSELQPQIIEGLITQILLKKECEDKKIKVSDEEAKKEIDKIIANLPEKLSLNDILKQSGLTKEMFEKDVKEQLKLEKLLDVSEPTDKELKAYYDENKAQYFEIPETVLARHILIATKETDDKAAKDAKKEKAGNLRKQLTDGADFEKLAEENSDCPSKRMGGKLPPFGRGQMVAEFEDAAFSMKDNEISPVVETKFGFHVIEKLKHNKPKTLTYNEVKDRIAAIIKGKALQEKISSYIQDLKKKAKVTYVHGTPPNAGMMFPQGMPSAAPSEKPKSK